jgi:hypothetical protein
VELSYDEDRVLTVYVWWHYRHLFTEFERKVAFRISVDRKTQNSPPEYAKWARARICGEPDPAVTNVLEEGVSVFQRRVRDRILAEDSAQVCINRCPVCQRIVRTPKAKQCMWCYHDWHGTHR